MSVRDSNSGCRPDAALCRVWLSSRCAGRAEAWRLPELPCNVDSEDWWWRFALPDVRPSVERRCDEQETVLCHSATDVQRRNEAAMNLSGIFIIGLGFAFVTAILDWSRAVHLIKQFGPQGERNPLMRFLITKSPVLGLIYKMFPIVLDALAGWVIFRDVQNIGVEYGNAPGVKDYWGI